MVRSLTSSELRNFLEYVEVESSNISTLDCSPESPERCLASAALLILKNWLPKQIETLECLEKRRSEDNSL